MIVRKEWLVKQSLVFKLCVVVMATLMLTFGSAARTQSATPTSTRRATATPTKKAAPTPTKKATATPTPRRAAAPTATLALALWVENTHAGNVTEYKGATLTKPGVSIPLPALTNRSVDFQTPNGGDTAGVTFDAFNNQWVTNCVGSIGNVGNITKFRLSTLKALTSDKDPQANVLITDNGRGKLLNCPWALTIHAGSLWVANSDQNTKPAVRGFVTEYLSTQLASNGSPVPHILTDQTEFISPTGVVFDSSGDLFVSDYGLKQFDKTTRTPGKIWVFKAATVASLTVGTNARKSNAHLSDPTMFTPVNGTFDRSGNLWVADCYANGTLTSAGEIYMFPKSVLTSGASMAKFVFQTTTIRTLNGTENTIECPGGIAFDAQGNLWYTNFESLSNTTHMSGAAGAVGEFTKSQLSPAIRTSKPVPNIFLEGSHIRDNFDGPIGLAFGPAL